MLPLLEQRQPVKTATADIQMLQHALLMKQLV